MAASFWSPARSLLVSAAPESAIWYLLLWYLQLCASPQSEVVSTTRSFRVLYRLIDLRRVEEIYFHFTQLTATNLLPVTLSCRRLWSLRSLQWAHRLLKIRIHDLIPDYSSILHALPRRHCSSIWRSQNQIDAWPRGELHNATFDITRFSRKHMVIYLLQPCSHTICCLHATNLTVPDASQLACTKIYMSTSHHSG